eukprot:TRINITY_DN10310_c0_g1_i3.p2 TRINITY_DN10310_c0_g1~~TRINITY_DN10310_c0_g1_i3.p2  ORF type:complete len:124 (+),score=24.35 TRINITY_DN10310_c0_g1_i3:251-622(+)
MSGHELEPWFKHLDQAIPHSIVGSMKDPTAKQSMVEFKYEFAVHTTHPSVRELLENIIWSNRMSEDPAPLYPSAPQQAEWFVEAWRISDLLDNLAGFLGLNTSYTVFIPVSYTHLTLPTKRIV